MATSPLHQFQIEPIVPMSIGGVDVSFTNSALWMVAAALLSTLLLTVGMGRKSLVPGRLQSVAELIYEFVANMVRENGGEGATKYLPLVFSIFIFILFGNLLGMIPGAFTFTSHIIVTFGLALTVFVFVTILALVKHGWHFFHFFAPGGVPKVLLLLIVPIEVISYFIRPVSLSIRLFANMMAGHTMLKVFAGFTVAMGTALGAAGWAMGVLPIVINVALVGFEIMVAALQAYVFAVLTCLYIKDALELH